MAIKLDKIKATNIELTASISSYIDKCVDALEKYVRPDDTSVSASVEIGKTTRHHSHGPVFRAEINFFAGGKRFRAVAEEENLYAALDKVKDEMSRELSYNKNRQQTLLRHGGAAIKNLLKGLRK